MRDCLRMSVHTIPLEHCREKLRADTEMGKMKRWGQRVKETGRACGVRKVLEKRIFFAHGHSLKTGHHLSPVPRSSLWRSRNCKYHLTGC